MKLTSSASFSPSIRISLRLKIHQAQAKNFCRVLDIRVAQVVETDTLHLVCDQKIWEMLAQEIGSNPLSHRVYIDIVKVIGAIDIPFDRQQLADFLCVERAAMSAELSKLQKEGLLVTKRNHFQLLTR